MNDRLHFPYSGNERPTSQPGEPRFQHTGPDHDDPSCAPGLTVEQRFDKLEAGQQEIRDQIAGLVKAWEAAGTLVGFVKGVAAFVTAVGTACAFVWAAIRFGSGHPH